MMGAFSPTGLLGCRRLQARRAASMLMDGTLQCLVPAFLTEMSLAAGQLGPLRRQPLFLFFWQCVCAGRTVGPAGMAKAGPSRTRRGEIHQRRRLPRIVRWGARRRILVLKPTVCLWNVFVGNEVFALPPRRALKPATAGDTLRPFL